MGQFLLIFYVCGIVTKGVIELSNSNVYNQKNVSSKGSTNGQRYISSFTEEIESSKVSPVKKSNSTRYSNSYHEKTASSKGTPVKKGSGEQRLHSFTEEIDVPKKNPAQQRSINRPINSYTEVSETPKIPPVKKGSNNRQHNIKFPVDPVMKLKLRTMFKQAARLPNKRPLSQTKFNSLLLSYGLQHIEHVDWTIPYVDSKVYMHTHAKAEDYQTIGGPYGLALRYGLSERRAVYCIMFAMIRWVEQSDGKLEEII